MKTPSEPRPRTDDEKNQAEVQIVELSKRIEFFITEYSVELLAGKMHDGEFVVPRYQREYVWDHKRKSRFIESLVLGLPIPFLFFWEMQDGRLEIVDGSQRLRSIEEFVLGSLRIGELESLTAMSGFQFSDLPESRQRKVKNRSIRGTALTEHADAQARFDLFERINTGSMIANMAEVRRGALAGPFMTLIMELAVLPEFVALAPMNKKAIAQREHEELVARYFAYGDGLDGYRDRPSDFIFHYVKKMNEKAAALPETIEHYRARFVETIEFVNRVFPYGFRKTAAGTATRRARFEAIAVGARLALNERPDLAPEDVPDVLPWLISKKFQKVTGSDGANAIARLRERTWFVRDRLLGTRQ